MAASRRSSLPLTAACLLAVALAVVGDASAPARAQAGGADLLKAMSGTWKGRGTVRESPRAAAEPVSCRYEGKLADSGLSLRITYVCLGVEFKFDATGALTFEPGSGRFTVTLTTPAANRRAEGSGRANGAGIELDLRGRHPETGAEVTSRLTMSMAGATRLVNVLRSTDPETGKSFQVFSATFGR